MDIFDQIRSETARVAAAAEHVQINDERIPEYAASLEPGDLGRDRPRWLKGSEREREAAYWLTLDAINFGSGWFPTLIKQPGMTGYRTIKAGLDRRIKHDGPWSAKQLQRVTVAELAMIMGQEPEHPLIALFKDSLRKLGAQVEQRHGGRFAGAVDAAAGSATKFVTEIAAWESFSDSSEYAGRQVPFLKRAQIAAADLRRAGVAQFWDLERLTLFADNLVPHVLRLDGILTFAPALLAQIEAGELIEHGSPEEVEIRACAVQAVERICPHAAGPAYPALLDELLWNRGQQPSYKAQPRHRSRCTAY